MIQENKFIILTGPRNRRHSTAPSAAWRNTRGVRRQKTGSRGALRPWPLLGFLQERQSRASKQFRAGWFESFQRALGYRDGL